MGSNPTALGLLDVFAAVVGIWPNHSLPHYGRIASYLPHENAALNTPSIRYDFIYFSHQLVLWSQYDSVVVSRLCWWWHGHMVSENSN